jgi:hypothetical protein
MKRAVAARPRLRIARSWRPNEPGNRPASGAGPRSGRKNQSSMPANVRVFFITPDANGIHGEPEITGLPIFDREFTLENSPLEKQKLLQAAMIWLRMA